MTYSKALYSAYTVTQASCYITHVYLVRFKGYKVEHVHEMPVTGTVCTSDTYIAPYSIASFPTCRVIGL